MSSMPEPILALQITRLGPLAGEFTAAGVWVLFNESAPEELAEFALLHRGAAPTRPLAPGQQIVIDDARYQILAVGPIANANLAALGHLVLKANGAAEAELPGDVCVEARPLPEPRVGMWIHVWANE
jgi:PTS system glucitol/sorbitol-specific IIA component